MSEFPSHKIDHISEYFNSYMEKIQQASKSVDGEVLMAVAQSLNNVFEQQGILYVCGNGGSAAISNHMTCDILKGVRSDTDLTPRIVSLSCNTEIITAVANDTDFSEIFAYQLRSMVKPCDALMTISSSGDSENIVKAILVAQEVKIPTYALTGFDGGRSAAIADHNLHVNTDNYGIVEDVHQSIMHTLAQYLRLSGMPIALINQRKF